MEEYGHMAGEVIQLACRKLTGYPLWQVFTDPTLTRYLMVDLYGPREYCIHLGRRIAC